MKNITTNSVKNELLNIERKALQIMHATMGFDFMKPYTAIKVEGKFTLNSVKKALQAAGADVDRKGITAIIVKNPNKYAFTPFAMVRAFLISDDFAIDFEYDKYIMSHSKIDYLNIKGDFTKWRKDAAALAYVFYQSAAHTVQPAADKTRSASVNFNDKNARFIFLKKEYGYTHIKRTDASGEEVAIRTAFIMDKSGYIMDSIRTDLTQRAKALRAQRAKDAYKQTDDGDKVKELEALVNSYREKLAQALAMARKWQTLRAISRALDSWNGLASVAESVERYKERSASHWYASIDDATKAYNTIKHDFERIDLDAITAA